MNSVFETLFLRRPVIDYVSPPVCEVDFSSSASPVIVLEDITKPLAPSGLILSGEGNFHLSWNVYPGALCYSIYKSVDELDPFGEYQIIAECIGDNFIDLDDFGPGYYKVTVITKDGESEFSDTVHIVGGGDDETCGCTDIYTVCPDDFSDLVGWYSADCLDLDDGDTVTEWEDKAAVMGNTTALTGPVFKVNIFGDKPAVYFTSTKSLIIPACPLFGDFTILAVTKLNTPGQVTILGNSDTDDAFLRTTNFGLGSGFQTDLFQGSSSRAVHRDVADATAQLNGVRRVDVPFAQTCQHSVNDSVGSPLPVLYDTSNFQFNRIGVGGFAYTPNDGYIAEICVWSRILTNLEVTSIFENYFQLKYSL